MDVLSCLVCSAQDSPQVSIYSSTSEIYHHSNHSWCNDLSMAISLMKRKWQLEHILPTKAEQSHTRLSRRLENIKGERQCCSRHGFTVVPEKVIIITQNSVVLPQALHQLLC